MTSSFRGEIDKGCGFDRKVNRATNDGGILLGGGKTANYGDGDLNLQLCSVTWVIKTRSFSFSNDPKPFGALVMERNTE